MADGAAFSPGLKKLVAVAAIVLIILGLHAAASVVNTFLLTMLFAIIASPYVEWLIGRGLKRGAAIGVAVLTVMVIGVAMILLVWGSLPRLTAQLPAYEEMLADRAVALEGTLNAVGVDGSALMETRVMNPSRLMSIAGRVIGTATSSVIQGILLLLLTVFFMLDMEYFRERGMGGGVVARFVAGSTDIRRYLAITGLTGLLAAVGNVALLVVLGIDFPVLWGVLAFFTNFIPNIGFYLALIPPVLLAVLEFGIGRAILIVVGYFVINTITDNIVKPRFLQKGVGITPFETLFSLVLWSWVLGPTGAILAVPLTLVVKSQIESQPGS